MKHYPGHLVCQPKFPDKFVNSSFHHPFDRAMPVVPASPRAIDQHVLIAWALKHVLF
jgi:hypothetical protein